MGWQIIGVIFLAVMSTSFFANGRWFGGILFGVGAILIALNVIGRGLLGAAQLRDIFSTTRRAQTRSTATPPAPPATPPQAEDRPQEDESVSPEPLSTEQVPEEPVYERRTMNTVCAVFGDRVELRSGLGAPEVMRASDIKEVRAGWGRLRAFAKVVIGAHDGTGMEIGQLHMAEAKTLKRMIEEHTLST